MVKTIAMVTRMAQNGDVVRTQLEKVGRSHRRYHLQLADLLRLKTVFLDVLGEYLGDHWDEACKKSWDDAFEQPIVLHITTGLAEQNSASDRAI